MNLGKLINELYYEKGFSYNITTGENNPSTGYMVSLNGYEERYFADDDFDNKDLKNFILKNSTQLYKHNRFFGGWIEDNQIFLDVSVNINNLEEAIYTGISNDQKAIYDCTNKAVITLPEPQKSGTMTQNRTYNLMKAKQLAYLMETTGVE